MLDTSVKITRWIVENYESVGLAAALTIALFSLYTVDLGQRLIYAVVFTLFPASSNHRIALTHILNNCSNRLTSLVSIRLNHFFQTVTCVCNVR